MNSFFDMIQGYLETEAEFREECADGQMSLLDFGFQKPKDKQRKITDFMPSEENGSDSR